jgi:3-dehydroquinate synthetase
MQITGRIHDRTFPIYIDNDILNQIPRLVPELAAAKRVVIITDREVSSLYLNRLQQTLAAAAITFTVITVDGAETGKNLDTVRIICEELADSAVTTPMC